MLKGPRRAPADALATSEEENYRIEGSGDEAVIYEKPRIIEMRRPQMSTKQATGASGVGKAGYIIKIDQGELIQNHFCMTSFHKLFVQTRSYLSLRRSSSNNAS